MKARDRMALLRFRLFHQSASLPEVHWAGTSAAGHIEIGLTRHALYLRTRGSEGRIVRFTWGDLIDSSARAIRDEPDEEGWTALVRDESKTQAELFDMQADELWGNSLYTVHVRRHIRAPLVVPGHDKRVLLTHLSVHRHDRLPVDDWRHMQRIKDELVGPQCEGVELYPAHERLVDTSNQYHVFVVEDPDFRWPFGYTERQVLSQSQMRVPGAVQRDPEYPDYTQGAEQQ